MADVAGWGSAAITFGLIQGALYLKAYWGHFGLDPFQFGAVSELALAGLVAIGMLLFFMLIAMLLGGWLEGKLTVGSERSSLTRWLVPTFFLISLAVLLWWTGAWSALIGAILTVLCALVVHLSPVIPATVKNSPWLIYAPLMLVYVSVISSSLGSTRAKGITSTGGNVVASLTYEGKVQHSMSLIGRLGDCYAFWDTSRKVTLLLPVGEVKRLEIVRGTWIPNRRARL